MIGVAHLHAAGGTAVDCQNGERNPQFLECEAFDAGPVVDGQIDRSIFQIPQQRVADMVRGAGPSIGRVVVMKSGQFNDPSGSGRTRGRGSVSRAGRSVRRRCRSGSRWCRRSVLGGICICRTGRCRCIRCGRCIARCRRLCLVRGRTSQRFKMPLQLGVLVLNRSGIPGCQIRKVLGFDVLDVQFFAFVKRQFLVIHVCPRIDALGPGQGRIDGLEQFQPEQSPVAGSHDFIADAGHELQAGLLVVETFHESVALGLRAVRLRLGRFPLILADLGPYVVMEREIQGAGEHQRADRCDGPGFLRADDPLRDDFARQQTRVEPRQSRGLQAQSVAHAVGENIVREGGRGKDRRAFQQRERLERDDVVTEVLCDVLLQAGQFDRIAHQQHAADLGFAVDTLEITDRSLNLRDHVVEDRPHRLEDRLRVFGLPRIAFQMLGLGERQFQFLGQLLGKVIAAQGNAALPHAESVGDHEVRRVGSHRQNHHRFGRIIRIEHIGIRAVLQHVVSDEVVNRQRGKLHEFQLDLGAFERFEVPMYLLAFHCEQAHFRIDRKTVDFLSARHALEVPDHFIKREGNLLLRLVSHDVRDLLDVDGRRLEELRQTALAGYRDGDLVLAGQLIAREELLQRLTHHRFGVGLGLREYLGILNVVESVRRQYIALAHATKCFQRALADVDTPNANGLGHGILHPVHKTSARRRRSRPWLPAGCSGLAS